MDKFIDFAVTTLQPGKPEVFELAGEYFELVSAADPVEVVLTDRAGAQMYRSNGMEQTDYIEDTPYDRFIVKSATLQTVRIAYGTGRFGSRRSAGSVSLLNQGGAFTEGRTSVGSGAVVELMPINTARRRLLVQNNTAAQNLRVTLDGSDPTATHGFRLIPGDMLDMTDYCPTGAIKARFESGAAADVEWAEG